ncbi:MAG: transposase [Defluviitaleaceae bacterium]|nr:transposase [Defluviitaleaceae bacterium]
MKEAADLNLPEINAFISGLQTDIEAVKNAITTNYNSGVAEGCVNKLKLIKRVMYGRCAFKMLKFKTLKLEMHNHFN